MRWPVCGTDGKTYGSICRLYYTNCWFYDGTVYVRKAYDGPCLKPEQPTTPEPRPDPKPPGKMKLILFKIGVLSRAR